MKHGLTTENSLISVSSTNMLYALQALLQWTTPHHLFHTMLAIWG